MNFKLILKIISIILMVVAAAQIPSLLWAFYFQEPEMIFNFLTTIGATTAVALAVFIFCRNLKTNTLSMKDGFFTVSLLWIISAAAGGLPFLAAGVTDSMAAAFFETMSGLTTTGATIFSNVEAFPKSLLFWRSTTHFLGGMGIVVLTVAVFPLIGINTINMVKAETTGPSVQKIMPKIAETARVLWYIYMILTLGEILLLKAAGMSWFDSMTHSMATISTGGFSVRNTSLCSYNSLPIDLIITFFMFAGGVNFVLYFSLITGNTKLLRNNSEFKAYTAIFIISALSIAFSLYRADCYSLVDSLRHGSFQAISIMTTTGFASADYLQWPDFAQMMLLALMFSGGCAGSTAGGIKIMRHVIVFKQSLIDMKRILRPKAVYILRDNDMTIKKGTILGVTSFIIVYLLIIVISSLIISMSGYDMVTSVSAALATLGNIGPGFGMIGPMECYSFFGDGMKCFLSFLMLAGRLELYTVLLLFTGVFWRR